MTTISKPRVDQVGWLYRAVIALAVLAVAERDVQAGFTLEVRDSGGNPVSGFRWLVEEDNTNQPIPGEAVWDMLAVDIHKSHAPVVAKGHTDGSSAFIDVPSETPYVVSVLPESGHTIGGGNVAIGQGQITVIVNAYPVPTAQISILAFHDNWPINNAPEVPIEAGLPGFTIVIHDAAGQVSQDAFGNPLGTTYEYDANGNPVFDEDGNPVVVVMGSGVITTDVLGEALVKYLAPGKYGIQIIPPADENWIQTTTIEGTPTIDAWVKAGEPPVFVEFGPAAYHVFVGFIQAFDNLGELGDGGGPTATITGRVVYNHLSRPPKLQGFFSGSPVEDAWVGLNEAFSRKAYYAQPCNPADGNFTISGVPEGTYQLVTWDKHLDSIFGFHAVTVPDPVQGYNIDLGDVLAFAWFGTLQGSVFFDADEDGFRDPEEIGMPGMGVLLRFRDGTIYQAAPTDVFGDYAFTEVFPFFKWLVAEVDFLRHNATGITTAVDYGGEIPPHDGWITPSFGKLNPQPQADINPNTGTNLSRTEIGQVLTHAMHLFLSQANVIDWGKSNYAPGESGGITGIVYYAVTRAEDDPRYAAAEPWESGVPRLQVNLYEDADEDGVIDELDGDGVPTLADRDNYPLGWFDDPGLKGDEDMDWNENGVFDPGDAIQVTWTDSWDDDTPTGCIQDLPVIHGHEVAECFDNFGTWNQVRPGVFDGGFAFASYFPGGMANNDVEEEGLPGGIYIVEAVPATGYETVKEEDKNVDYGDEYIPGDPLAAIPPACVGDLHTVPDYLTLFGDIEAPFAGTERPLCDRKQVTHSCGQNTGVEFFLFTEVPKAARAVGFINNDLAPEFDQSSPIFGEKQAPSWLPISFQDYVGNEITRVYCDEFGAYNALLPSSFTVNLPSPTGVSPHMISFVINHPGPIPDPEGPPGELIMDPWFDAGYSQTPYTFNFESGRTTYLDTPVIPVAAFVGYPTYGVDIDPPDETPMIHSVKGRGSAKGPYVCADGELITIGSLGPTRVVEPGGGIVRRDYGFGRTRGEVTVGGVPLTIRVWNSRNIRAVVDTDLVSTGQLLVTRGDNGRTTPLGVTLHVLDDCSSVVEVTQGGAWPNTPIQDAIDAAAPGTLIIVGPGVYKENPIIYKQVKLQGAGAGGTFINGNPVPFERVTAWHNKINALIASGDLDPIDPGMFEPIEAPCIFVHGKPETFDEDSPGLIDGFTIMGGVSGGGIYAAGYADYLEISNNKLMNNQGTFGGGVTVGLSDQSGFNDHVNIHHNLIGKNGGINGAGGVTIFRGSDNYSLADNLIIGNFTRFSGGGVCHHGLSDGGTIARNQIVFNEVFYGGELGGEGGGIYVGGGVPDPGEPPGQWAPGAGSVTIVSNLLQGNLAGSDSGGGLRAFAINGSESAELDPADWYTLKVFSNMIVNNVAAYQGGGIALTDVAKSHIIHNTVANNDCTATSALAFPPGNLLQSNPQGAGIVSTQHSPNLAGITGPLGLPSFSDAQLVDNVVWHNRSFYWDGTLNDFKGELVANDPPHWDLQVVGAGSLNPQYCVLTDTSGYDASNISDDPIFVTEYNNTLLTASVLDEGGNFITVRYTELTISDGDYHLQLSSPAIDAGTDLSATFPELATDFDGEARPNPDTGLVDIGADEVYTPGAAAGPKTGGAVNTPNKQPSGATKGAEL